MTFIVVGSCWRGQQWKLGRGGLCSRQIFEDLARSTNGHLFFPSFLDGSVAYCSVDKPTHLAGMKFPGRTIFLVIFRAISDLPAVFGGMPVRLYSGNQKKYLPFNRSRHRPPALLVTVNRFDGHTKQLGHLFLGLFKFLAIASEFLIIHARSFSPAAIQSAIKISDRGVST